jgi:hypothetical protein
MLGMLPVVILVVFATLYLIDLLTNVRALVELRLARRRLARTSNVARDRTARPVDGAVSLDALLQELHAA